MAWGTLKNLDCGLWTGLMWTRPWTGSLAVGWFAALPNLGLTNWRENLLMNERLWRTGLFSMK